MAIAPAGWGQFRGDLLVGNNNPDMNGLTTINAYNLTTGAFAGTLTLNTGKPFSVDELWALSFGNGHSAGSVNTLYFTAGLSNNTGAFLGPSLRFPSRAPHCLDWSPPGCVRESGRGRRVFGTRPDCRTQQSPGRGAPIPYRLTV